MAAPRLADGLRARGRRQARRRRRRQRLDRRHARAGRDGVSGCARRDLGEPRVRPREQPRCETCDAPYSSSSIPIPRSWRAPSASSSPRWTPAGRRARRRIQQTADGTTWPTIRYFPSVTRSLCEAFGSEQWPLRRAGPVNASWTDALRAGVDCDWTSGSFMLARREALLTAGLLDERFFIYSEEPDLCLRIKRAGWRVRHFPSMTIVHHAAKAGSGRKWSRRTRSPGAVRTKALQQAVRFGVSRRGRRGTLLRRYLRAPGTPRSARRLVWRCARSPAGPHLRLALRRNGAARD